MILSFFDTIKEWMQPVNDWLRTHHNNPAFWLIAVLLGLFIFAGVYNALRKEH